MCEANTFFNDYLFKGTFPSVTCSRFCSGHCDLLSLFSPRVSLLPDFLTTCQVLISFTFFKKIWNIHLAIAMIGESAILNALMAWQLYRFPFYLHIMQEIYKPIGCLPPHTHTHTHPLLSEGLVHFPCSSCSLSLSHFDRWDDAISLRLKMDASFLQNNSPRCEEVSSFPLLM